MDERDVEQVRKIVRDELGPALATERKRLEDSMIAAQQAQHAFEEKISQQVGHHHAENRLRLQQNYEQSVKAVAGNDFILMRMDKQDEEASQTRLLMQQLLAKVEGWAGRREGEIDANAVTDKQHEKWIGWVVKVGGVLASGSLYKWLAGRFHWWWLGK